MNGLSLSRILAIIAFALVLLSLFVAIPLWIAVLILCLAVIIE